MRTSTKDQRLRFFWRGNTRCPICLVEFSESDVRLGKTVTIEHAPPKSFQREFGLRSRALCLTCYRCNNTAGKQMDQAALMASKPIKTHVQIGDVSCNASMTLSEGEDRDFAIVTKSTSGPIDYRHVDATDFKVTFKLPNPGYVNASWLKSGYLSVFSLLGRLGYRYAEGPAICKVREQIMNPGKEIIKYVPVAGVTGRDDDWVAMDTTGVRPCWIVSFGDRVTLLPPGWDTEFYEDDSFRAGNEIKLGGDGYHWNRRRFGHYRAGSFTPSDRGVFEEVVGQPEFGAQLRTTNRDGGAVEHFVLADYHNGGITTLPVQPPT